MVGFRFRKSINLPGGFRVNASKSGLSYSWGTKGYRVTKTAKGTTRRTITAPGTGISYSEETGGASEERGPENRTGCGGCLIKIIVIPAAMIIILVLLLLIFKKPNQAEVEPAQTPPPAAPASTAQAENTAKKAVEEYLSGLGYEVVKTKESAAMLEFMLTLSGFSEQDLTEPPENWEEIHANLLDASTGAKEAAEGALIVLYLQDSGGNNYLTISDGQEKYSAFKTYSTEVFNPPTITMEEYNAISPGMTFQEVYDIVGGPGEVTSEIELSSYTSVTREWQGTGGSFSYAAVTFDDGKVRSKHQYGLE